MKAYLFILFFLLIFSHSNLYSLEIVVFCSGYAESCQEWRKGCFRDYYNAYDNCIYQARKTCADLGFLEISLKNELNCESGLKSIKPRIGYTHCSGKVFCEH